MPTFFFQAGIANIGLLKYIAYADMPLATDNVK